MEDDVSIYEYTTPVHRVLLEPNIFFGIGIVPAMFILITTMILMNMISIWCLGIGIVLYIIAKLLCKKDPYMLSILFSRLMVPSIWRAS